MWFGLVLAPRVPCPIRSLCLTTITADTSNLWWNEDLAITHTHIFWFQECSLHRGFHKENVNWGSPKRSGYGCHKTQIVRCDIWVHPQWSTSGSYGDICVTNWVFLSAINTSRYRQNGRHFADHRFKTSFLYNKVCILIQITLKFNPKGPVDDTNIDACCCGLFSGAHISDTRPQRVSNNHKNCDLMHCTNKCNSLQ